MKIYERRSFPRSPRDLKTMYEKGNLSFDNAVQRAFVWQNSKKNNKMSMLIDSMIRGFPVPPMYCNCIFTDPQHRVYDFLDGKQRTITIVRFLEDKFSLINLPTFENEEGEEFDLNGLTFSELPEYFQEKIKLFSISVYYYENMEQEDAEEMFRRLNNGKSLTAIELARVNAVSKDKINKLGKHELFKIALSEKALAGYVNEDIVVKVFITLFSDKKSLEKKNTNPIMENTIISDEQFNEIHALFDSFVKVYEIFESNKRKKIIRKIFHKPNFISLLHILKIAKDSNIEIEKVEQWINVFFDTDTKDFSIDSEYNENATGRAAVTEEAVNTRLRILENSFHENIN